MKRVINDVLPTAKWSRMSIDPRFPKSRGAIYHTTLFTEKDKSVVIARQPADFGWCESGSGTAYLNFFIGFEYDPTACCAIMGFYYKNVVHRD
jgi:hypothetical protein